MATDVANHRLRAVALTGGRNVPSARFRIRQLLPVLTDLGIDTVECVPRVGTYPPRSRIARPFWGVGALAARLPGLLRSRRADVTILQRELLSTLFTLEPLAGRPRVLDVDDAVFLHGGGRAARRLAGAVDLVVCGNAYLAEGFSRWNGAVEIVPTAVDTDRFRPGPPRVGDDCVMVWTGTYPNQVYLAEIAPAVAQAMAARPGLRLRVVGDVPPRLPELDPARVEFVRWTPSVEVTALQEADLGLMPLADTPWTRGKCSFKMLQYMACGLPSVVSPVGMNRQVLDLAPLGIGPRDQAAWTDALVALADDPDERRRLGAAGRKAVVAGFGLPAVAELVAAAWRRAVA